MVAHAKILTDAVIVTQAIGAAQALTF